MVEMKLDASEVIRSLDALIGKAAGGMTRPIAQAGAQVFADEVKRRAGALTPKTGNLVGSIYQAYSKDKSYRYGSTYNVSWRVKKGGLPRAPHAHLVEFGYMRRFKINRGPDGRWWTIVRPAMREEYRRKFPYGTPGRMSLAEKSKYFFRLSADVRVEARPFLQPAYAAARDRAVRAMMERANYELVRFGSP